MTFELTDSFDLDASEDAQPNHQVLWILVPFAHKLQNKIN